jgi:O-antigen/teichoic acid export membrane protein
MIGFVTGLLIARALNPAGYGDLMFLIGSFAAVRSLMDMGSSSAFFTFLSQRSRGGRFYITYFLWLAFQFGITLLLLWLIIPPHLFDGIWLGSGRGIVMLAFVAVFTQQQVWQTVVQIGEARRKTMQVQFMNIVIALVYLAVIGFTLEYGQLSVEKILIILICQYAGAALISYRILRDRTEKQVVEEKSSREIIQDYWQYCKPMVALALVGFAYEFANRWILQKFGGSTQQGYFQVANQFAVVSLLATSSILNVFWKEIAHAWERQDRTRVEMLYRKISRALVMLGACVSGLLIPWSEQIVHIALGSAYVNAWPVLAIMLLYPVHQSMGQIGGAMLLASGQTHRYMIVSVSVMLISIPITYVVLAPASGGWVQGLEMGALGMACRMVILGIVSVNIQAWVIARYGGWKFDWVFQAVGISLMVVLGYLAKLLTSLIWALDGVGTFELVVPVIFESVVYLTLVAWVIWLLPWLIGTDRKEIAALFNRLKKMWRS